MTSRLSTADYHVHSTFSDGHEDVVACCERARSLGLAELGFSEHLTPPCLAAIADYGVEHERLGEYVASVREAAARHPDLQVLCGVEADFAPEGVGEMAGLLVRHAFDYVLCSVHFTDGFQFNAAEHRGDPGWDDPGRVWRRYWELVREAAESGLFDVLAHPDLPKRWGHRHEQDLTTLEDEAIAALAAAGMALEINTSGLRHPVGELYPTLRLLARAREAGVPLTFGSDAHHAADIGAGFSEALTLARAAGYDSWLRLSDGRSVALPA
jgi:histidinol-phosphatase (PHP family)